MPRNGSGVYSPPSGTTAVTQTTIESAKYNAFVADLVADANAARPIVAGGTGAASASAARTALGLAIGTDVQAYNAILSGISGLGSVSAYRMLYTGASANTFTTAAVGAGGLSVLATNTVGDARTALGLGTAATAGFIDEDSFATNSATAAPSQQSTKAYVDTAVSNVLTGADNNVLASRAVNTSYQNTRGKPILVAVSSSNSAGGQSSFLAISDDNSTWWKVAGVDSADNAVTYAHSAVVPKSWYYRLTSSGGTVTISAWMEVY